MAYDFYWWAFIYGETIAGEGGGFEPFVDGYRACLDSYFVPNICIEKRFEESRATFDEDRGYALSVELGELGE